MIQITPAILTNNQKELSDLLNRYLDEGFHFIDIDITSADLAGEQTTLSLKDAIQVVEIPEDFSIGWHLMMKEPEESVKRLLTHFEENESLRIYVHQETDLEFLSELEDENYSVMVTVNVDSPLLDIDYYNQFAEVQLMTVEIGKQGAAFQQEAMNKSEQLREWGYEGVISIDGGVNLETAQIISKYPIDRVSVGSYFQNSSDLTSDLQKLEEVLNP